MWLHFKKFRAVYNNILGVIEESDIRNLTPVFEKEERLFKIVNRLKRQVLVENTTMKKSKGEKEQWQQRETSNFFG